MEVKETEENGIYVFEVSELIKWQELKYSFSLNVKSISSSVINSNDTLDEIELKIADVKKRIEKEKTEGKEYTYKLLEKRIRFETDSKNINPI